MFGRRKSTPLDMVIIVVILIACFSSMAFIVQWMNPIPAETKDPADLVPVTVEVTGFSKRSSSERLRKYDIPRAYVKYEFDGKEYNSSVILRTLVLPDDLSEGDVLELAVWPDDPETVVASPAMRKAKADAIRSKETTALLVGGLFVIVLVMAFILLKKPKPDDESIDITDIDDTAQL